jgi:Holliday junction resolvasome RuvABC DNA-binding subunit
MEMSKHPTNQNSNRNNNTDKPIATADDVREVIKETVAETVDQLVTTQQEKPQENPAPQTEEKKLPDYDTEKVKTMNVSQTIRYLHSLGYDRGQIVKVFPKVKGRTILYQHVRNVLITPVKVQS